MGKKKREHVVFDQMLKQKKSIPFSIINREDSKKREELLFTRIGEISKTLSDVANTLALIDERIEKLEEKEK